MELLSNQFLKGVISTNDIWSQEQLRKPQGGKRPSAPKR